jgi:hypothetical protein
MLKNRKVALYIWPALILAVQLLLSAGSFYWHGKFKTLSSARATQVQGVSEKLNAVACPEINKEAIKNIASLSVVSLDDFAQLLLAVGQVSLGTAVFSLLAIAQIKKKNAHQG